MIKQYIVDAFTDKVFHGNPAAICILEQWLSEETMMNIPLKIICQKLPLPLKRGILGQRIGWATAPCYCKRHRCGLCISHFCLQMQCD